MKICIRRLYNDLFDACGNKDSQVLIIVQVGATPTLNPLMIYSVTFISFFSLIFSSLLFSKHLWFMTNAPRVDYKTP